MVKFYERRDTFKFPWDQVAQAFWSRYPNPYSTHVLSEDVVDRRIDGGKLFTKRLLTKTNRLPKWGERFVNSRSVCIVEESIVDPINNTIVTYTRNIGLRAIMTIEEKCIYRPSSENPKYTIVDRQAWISSSLRGFAYAIQAFGVERFKQNVTKATKGFTYVLERMFLPQSIPAIEGGQSGLLVDKEKLKERAKIATELAKSKAAPLVAAASAYSNKQ